MSSIRKACIGASTLAILAALCCARGHGQATLLMEEPFGVFGVLNPTGHSAIYLERVCAETPLKLRRCESGELGSVIARYYGIEGYDWIAIPLVPYLYAVESIEDVPARADSGTVERLRSHYRETHLQIFGNKLPKGTMFRSGWTQMVGQAYDRSMYAFRFATTPEQDDALIASLNTRPNRSHFSLLFNNCGDFARSILNTYYPRAFRRSFLPDAEVTTPKQVSYQLERYGRKHPQTQLAVFEIAQVPGSRRKSLSTKDVDGSLVTTAYIVPIAVLAPPVAGALLADYLIRGRYHLGSSHPEVLGPDELSEWIEPELTPATLTAFALPTENPDSAGAQVPSAAIGGSAETQNPETANSGLEEIKATNE